MIWQSFIIILESDRTLRSEPTVVVSYRQPNYHDGLGYSAILQALIYTTVSQQPHTPAAKRAIEEAVSPSPSPSLRQPAKKKSYHNLPKGSTQGGQRKQVLGKIFDPIEYKPHGTTAPTTPSPIVAPKRATSHISASNVLLTRPRIDLPQAVVEDSEDTESSLPEAEPSGGLGDTGDESAVELSVEEDDSLPAVMAGSSFPSIRESRAPFSSPAKGVPVFKRTEELRKKQVFTPEADMATRVKWAFTALENAGFNSIAAFLDAVCTTREFPARTTCAELQKEAWEDGIPQTLTLLSRHVAATDSYGKRPYDLTPYRNAVTRAAETEYEREFLAFPKRRDRRLRDRVTGKKVGPISLSCTRRPPTLTEIGLEPTW